MRTKVIMLLVLLIIGHRYVLGQNMPGESSKPDNKSVEPKGESIVNVDKFTGRGTVTIPVFSKSIDGVKCGVSLSYAATGIRVDDMASPVGLGWNLVTGGSITRRVMGIEDEITTPAQFDVSGTDYFEGYLVPGASLDGGGFGIEFSDDRESDVFIVDLCGRQLELVFFYDGSTLSWHTYPQSDINIELYTKVWDANNSVYNNVAGVQSGIGQSENDKFLSFVITDEKGNKYYFERGDYRLQEYKYENANLLSATIEGSYYVTTKWNLEKVETIGGRELVLEYNTTDVDYVEYISEKYTPMPMVWDNQTYDILYDPFEKVEVRWVGKKSLVSKITYPDGVTVTFNSDNGSSNPVDRCDCEGDFVLRDIVIEDKYDNNVSNNQRFVFNYAYFSTPPDPAISSTELPYASLCNAVTSSIDTYFPTTQDKEEYWQKGLRLKLKKIRKEAGVAPNGRGEDYFTFTYNSTPLPYRFSSSVDYYGYYNGKSSIPFKRENPKYAAGLSGEQYLIDDTRIPYLNESNRHANALACLAYASELISGYSWGADRSYDFSKAQAFSLTKVTNGLGGATGIEYTSISLPTTPPAHQYQYTVCTTSGGNCSTYHDIDMSGLNTTGIVGVGVFDGLCIGKVTLNNGYSTEHNTSIEYTYGGGQQFNTGGYAWYWNLFSGNASYVSYSNNQYVCPNWSPTFTDYFVGRDDLLFGSNHGFSVVTKTIKGYNNDVLSKDKFYYTNVLYNNGTESNMLRYTGDEYRTAPSFLQKYAVGNLLRHERIKEDNTTTTDVIVSKKEYTYEEVSYNNAAPTNNFINVYIANPTPITYSYPNINNKISRVKTLVSISNTTDLLGNPASGTSTVTYEYNNKFNIDWVESTDSKGDTYRKYYMYNYDYYGYLNWNTTIPVLGTMNMMGLQYLLSTGLWRVTGPSSTDRELLHLSMEIPEVSNGTLRFPASYTSALSNPLAHNLVWPPNYNSAEINREAAMTNTAIAGTNFERVEEVTLYGSNNLTLEVRKQNLDIYNSSILDNKRGLVLASASNAKYEDIAFSSFEVTDVDNDGNWNIDWSKVQYAPTASMTGKYVYQLIQGSNDIESNSLNNKKYIISFWGKTTSMDPELEVVDPGNNTTSVPLTMQNSVGDWNLYSASISTNTGDKLRILNTDPGSDIYIDEVRLHPSHASMTTNTYEPLFGVSSTSDNSNYLIYNEYDLFGNLHIVRDMDGNIIKKIETVVAGPESGANNNGGGVINPGP